MTDVVFIVAGYGVILGGMGLYVAILLRRLRLARAAQATPQEAAAPPVDAIG
jgi:hypothetical protein